MNVAINGFGRIGRSFLRSVLQDATDKINIVAINIGPADKEHVAHLFKYDTTMGTFDGSVSFSEDILTVKSHSSCHPKQSVRIQEIKILVETDPEKLPWKDLGIDWVVECSGRFTKKVDAQKHQTAGAKAVLISAPSSDADRTIIMGLNQIDFNKESDTIVSAGSCTTNALVPLLDVLQDTCGIKSAYMTTIHAYTNNQTLLDLDGKDLRRARAAAMNIIPTTTGAMKVVGQVMPSLAGKIEGCSLRVPVSNVSLVDLSFIMENTCDAQSLNAAFKNGSDKKWRELLSFSAEPCVSSDYKGNASSVIIDGLMTQATGTLGKVFGWYDNEWGYSCRLKDFLVNCL
jgi:glyceraldehyde 3-phosphate dehydrogenase